MIRLLIGTWEVSGHGGGIDGAGGGGKSGGGGGPGGGGGRVGGGGGPRGSEGGSGVAMRSVHQVPVPKVLEEILGVGVACCIRIRWVVFIAAHQAPHAPAIPITEKPETVHVRSTTVTQLVLAALPIFVRRLALLLGQTRIVASSELLLLLDAQARRCSRRCRGHTLGKCLLRLD